MKGETIYFDVDNTLTNETCYSIEEALAATPNIKLVESYRQLYDKNFMIIWTARRDELIPATLEWLRRNNLRWHAFSNLKPPRGSKNAIYVDDGAYNVNDIDKLL